MKTITLFLLVGLHLFSGSNSACDSLIVPDDANCTCPGQVIIFTCSILGGGITVWDGTAFSCSGSTDEIDLRHTDFDSRGASGSCNNGAIEAMSIGVMNDCYTSQLMVQVSPSLNNTTIRCSHDSTMGGLIGTFTLNFVYVPPEPSGVMVTKVNMTEITFSWTAVNSICSGSINYIVTSPNCIDVRCTNSSRNESTCSNLPVASTCAFSISSEICGQTETVNNAITVTLRRPRTSITPVYSAASTSILTRVMIIIYQESFVSVAGDVPSRVTEYRLSNSDISIPACEESEVMCQRSIDAATFACPPSANIVVSLSALNRLGRGPSSEPTTLGCINEFVSVRFDSATSTITCNFLDEMDTSIKSCSVMYGQQCDEMLVPGPQRNSTVEGPNSITLAVDSEIFGCYLVSASNDSFSIIVEVRTSMGSGSARTGVIIGIVFGVIGAIAISLVVGVILVVAVVNARKKQEPPIRGEKGDVDVDDRIPSMPVYAVPDRSKKKKLPEKEEQKPSPAQPTSSGKRKGFTVNKKATGKKEALQDFELPSYDVLKCGTGKPTLMFTDLGLNYDVLNVEGRQNGDEHSCLGQGVYSNIPGDPQHEPDHEYSQVDKRSSPKRLLSNEKDK